MMWREKLQSSRLWRKPVLLVSILALGAYYSVARAVDNFYPVSTFPMYGGLHVPTGSRIVARDAHGDLHEVTDYSSWSCDRKVDTGVLACGSPDSIYYIPYLDQAAGEHIAVHQGHDARAQPVDVVRHIWHFSENAPPQTEDCLLASCRAVGP